MNEPGSQAQQELSLTEALARFCDVEMPVRNLSPDTLRGYTYDLTEWVATMPPFLPVSALSTDVIAHYLSTLDGRGLKGSTRHRKVAAIKTFLRYLEREGHLPPDFSTRVSWPEVQRDNPARSVCPSTQPCCGRPATIPGTRRFWNSYCRRASGCLSSPP